MVYKNVDDARVDTSNYNQDWWILQRIRMIDKDINNLLDEKRTLEGQYIRSMEDKEGANA